MNARISCLFSFHSYLSISYRLDTLILTVDMSSQKKEPPSNKKIAQSIDTNDLDGRLALAGKFIFVAPLNSTAAAMHMARCNKEEQASTVKRRIVQINCDKLKQKPVDAAD